MTSWVGVCSLLFGMLTRSVQFFSSLFVGMVILTIVFFDVGIGNVLINLTLTLSVQ